MGEPDWLLPGDHWLQWPGPPMWTADISVTVTDNPVVGELLGPDGKTLIEVRERAPIGYRRQ